MIIFYDTETTGLPLWREPSEHPDQPHIVEIASMNALIRPDGWTISPEAAAIHGISQERALAETKSPKWREECLAANPELRALVS